MLENQPTKPPVHWITEYAPASAILHSKAFREVTFKGLIPLLGHTIVTVEGTAHYQRRALEGRLFALAVLRAHERDFVSKIIADTLQPILAEGAGDLVEFSHAIASRIAARVIGLDGLADPARLHEASHLLSALVGGTSINGGEAGEVLTRREARNRLRERFINGAIDRRRQLLKEYQAGRLEQAALPFDLITLLLQHSNSELKTNARNFGSGWDVRQIAAEVAFYAVAAEDTTATLLPRLMHEIWYYAALYPQQTSLLQNLDFLRKAAAEALRLHPVVPTIFRQANQAVQLAGYDFVEGQTAGIYLPSVNRDPIIFGPNAPDFFPLRELPAKIRRSGLSFGGGSHLCLGRELALGSPQFGAAPTQLDGEAALIAHALLQHHARPDLSQPITEPSAYERNVFRRYPILLG